MNQRGFAPILILLLGVLIGGAAVYFLTKQKIATPPAQKACTMEAKICPDGSTVGRTGPNCEFAECPADETTNWEIYRNSAYKVTFKYPADWEIVSDSLKNPPEGYPEVDYDRSVHLGPTGVQGPGYDGYFALGVYLKLDANVEEVIAEMGDQFDDRVEKRENVTINGKAAIKVTITTTSIPEWVYINHVIETKDYIYVFGNGAIEEHPALYDQIAKTIEVL